MKDDVKPPFGGAFEGKKVVVSGGTSGIGLSIARGFAEAGAKVVSTGSSKVKIRALADAGEKGLTFARLDVRDGSEVQAFFAALGRLDVLVNCQGISRPDAEWQEEEFLTVLDINLSSVMRLSIAAFPLLEASGGNIVNVASMLSYLADDTVPAYTASKTGVVGLTRAQAHRYGRAGVRVNAIAPGYHRTDMTRSLWEDPASAEKIAERSALKRWGEADDLIGPTLFVASPAASFVTGAVIPVDGGYHTG